MTAAEKLRRQVSQLYQAGGDPYNTADTVQLSRELVADFVTWVTGPIATEGAGDGYLHMRQAE